MLCSRAALALGSLVLVAAFAEPATSLDVPALPVYADSAYLVGNHFLPSVIVVESGRLGVWHHGELAAPDVIHTVTADDGTFDSGPMLLHKIYTADIPHPPGAEVPYHCSFHEGMTGTILVT